MQILIGHGVRGRLARDARTIRVADVKIFRDLLAAILRQNPRFFVPLIIDGMVIAILDVDSPVYDCFSRDDRGGIEKLCRVFVARLRALGARHNNFI